jgi:hypothetical protein
MTINPKSLENLQPFVKGDKRVNRKGRIDNFAKFRKLAQSIGNEMSAEEETLFAQLLRALARSKNPADRALYLAYAVGKPKDEIEHSGVEKVEIEVKYVKAED